MKVYISHSANTEIGPLRNLLEREGVSFRDSYDPTSPTDFQETVSEELRAADSVIAVITEGARNVFFELGFALALRKPVLALLTPGTVLPSFLMPLNYLTSDLTDSEVLRVAVSRFLDKSKVRHSRSKKTRKGSVVEQQGRIPSESFAQQLSILRGSGNALEVQRVVGLILRSAEAVTVEENRGANDRGVDFAVWSNALQRSLGNPLLIEVKASKLDEHSFQLAYTRLIRQVRESGSASGLLLYLDSDGKRFKKPEGWLPSVLWLDAEDFARQAAEKSFPEVLVQQRNRSVHGLLD
jgi:nucleoside 2-deoxyribosyltransferase